MIEQKFVFGFLILFSTVFSMFRSDFFLNGFSNPSVEHYGLDFLVSKQHFF